LGNEIAVDDDAAVEVVADDDDAIINELVLICWVSSLSSVSAINSFLILVTAWSDAEDVEKGIFLKRGSRVLLQQL
jgi:hypothetical protein